MSSGKASLLAQQITSGASEKGALAIAEVREAIVRGSRGDEGLPLTRRGFGGAAPPIKTDLSI